MARKLNESSAVIVGGTSGIGFAAAKSLLRSGLQKLTICARDVTKGRNALSKLAAEFPGAYLHFVQCDASDPARTETAITHAELAMGRDRCAGQHRWRRHHPQAIAGSESA
ncbi:SDR family NAD(P)-dependent oxidoreductase (plasmid) [Microbulbifer sp. MKSA007]|nr:SDR family NAD(P)-dependent oxidoreductase [Microbulbifer sp. MKSA007]